MAKLIVVINSDGAVNCFFVNKGCKIVVTDREKDFGRLASFLILRNKVYSRT